jgi:hypothetical protein
MNWQPHAYQHGETNMAKKDFWQHPENPRAEVFRSSYSRGSRYSMLGSASHYAVRGASLGRTFFSRADAHAVLIAQGYSKVTS